MAAYLVTLATVTADRLVKDTIATGTPAPSGVIFSPWLQFRPTVNPHLAYGIPFPPGLAPWLTLLVMFAFGRWWWDAFRQRFAWLTTALSFTIIGAGSNLVDRIRWGAVVDYLDVTFFAVFNLADVMISVGVGMLLLRELARWWRKKRKV